MSPLLFWSDAFGPNLDCRGHWENGEEPIEHRIHLVGDDQRQKVTRPRHRRDDGVPPQLFEAFKIRRHLRVDEE